MQMAVNALIYIILPSKGSLSLMTEGHQFHDLKAPTLDLKNSVLFQLELDTSVR